VIQLVAFYGTLLSVHGAQDHLGIRARCRFLAPCTLRGRLYDFGPYPALVDGDGIVYAELFAVDEDTLRVIDAFEGYDPEKPGDEGYVRIRVRPVDSEAEVWVYRYHGDLGDAIPIDSGDYRAGNSAW
jgi:gamma-glutamylcyclotransferase (GGCT)/AIG2-like uncharacterized protein YtfP